MKCRLRMHLDLVQKDVIVLQKKEQFIATQTQREEITITVMQSRK
jgi:hypothetical protein